MQLIDVIKDTLTTLKNKNIAVTPKNYAKEFNSRAKDLDILPEELIEYKDKLKRLTRSELKKVNSLNINTNQELVDLLLQRVTDSEIKKIVNSLREILMPSINSYELENDIEELLAHLFLFPKELIENTTLTKLKDYSKRRIEQDRKVLRNKTEDINKLTSLIGKYFDDSIKANNDYITNLKTIKTQIDSLDISTSSQREMTNFKSRLMNSVIALEEKINTNYSAIDDNKSHLSSFENSFDELKSLIKQNQGLGYNDALTNVLNYEGLDIEFRKFESEYDFFGTDYAIVFFDIDEFSLIIEDYGIDCGNTILKTFAKVLRKLTRSEDIIARYKEDKFVALVHYNEDFELEKYVSRVNNLIKKSKFTHENEMIKVTFSASTLFRRNYTDYKVMFNEAKSILNNRNKLVRNNIFMKI